MELSRERATRVRIRDCFNQLLVELNVELLQFALLLRISDVCKVYSHKTLNVGLAAQRNNYYHYLVMR